MPSGEHGRHTLSRLAVEKGDCCTRYGCGGDSGSGAAVGSRYTGAHVRPRCSGAQRDHATSLPAGDLSFVLHSSTCFFSDVDLTSQESVCWLFQHLGCSLGPLRCVLATPTHALLNDRWLTTCVRQENCSREGGTYLLHRSEGAAHVQVRCPNLHVNSLG